MSTDLEDAMLRSAVRKSTAEARSGLDDHPGPDDLLAYHEGELEEVSAERLREHLALCPDCAQQALDLAMFSRSELADEDDLSSSAASQAWPATRLMLEQEGLFGEASPMASKVDKHAWRFSSFIRSPRLAYAAAAVFFLASVGLSLRLADLSRADRDLPRANVQLVDLHPLGEGNQRADGSPLSVTTAALDKDLMLILNLLDPGTFSRHRVEIRDLLGRMIWSTAELKWSSDDKFTVFVPRQLMTAKRFSLQLYGVEDDRAELLAEYALALEAP